MSNQTGWESSIPGRANLNGRSSGGGPIFSSPEIVTILVILNGLIFISQSVLPWTWVRPVIEQMAFVPERFTLGMKYDVDPVTLIQPVFGHMFVHADITHILFNSLWLIVFGTGVARRMGTDWGNGVTRAFRSGLFLTFYLLCGLGGLMAYFLVQPDSSTPVVGASGAISGLMGAAMRFVVRDRIRSRDPATLAPLLSPPIILVSVAFTLMNLATAFTFGVVEGPRIAWEAHLGGFFAGLLLFPLFDIGGRQARRTLLG